MSINFELFRVYFAIARYQNITRAAEELCLSRPTVTQELQKLEKQIGFTLFSRHSRGVRLTQEGKELFHKISPAIQVLLDTERELESFRAPKSPETIKICFTHPHTLHAFQEILSRFHDGHPDLVLQSSIIPHALVPEALNSGFAELAFGARHDYKPYLPDEVVLPNIQSTSLGIFEDVFLVHEHLSHLANTPTPLKALAEYQFIFYKDRDMSGMEHYLTLLGQNQEKQERNLYLSELDAIFKLLKYSDSIAIIPAFHLRYLNRDFTRLQILDPIIHTEYLLQYSKRKLPRPVVMELAAYLQNSKNQISNGMTQPT